MFRVTNFITNKIWQYTTLRYYRRSFVRCGAGLQIASGVIIDGCNNVSVGENTYIGPQSIIYSTEAKLFIGNDFIGGPRLTIMTGDHRFDIVGKTIAETTDKNNANDTDVIIEDDVWCGANVTILKGVTVGRGSVIAAGAIVTNNVPPYSVYINSQKIRKRFTDEQIIEHERLLREKK